MPIVTIVTGLLLTALGVGFYVGSLGTEKESITALIPAAVGLPLVVLGWLARQERFLKHAMHAAAALGLIGFLAALGRLVPGLVRAGVDVTNPAQVAVALMALICGVFVGLCVRSFMVARRNRARSQEG
jgi:hypothetical protein